MRSRHALALILIGLTLVAARCPEAVAVQGIAYRGVAHHRFPLRLFCRRGVQRTPPCTSDSAGRELNSLRRAVEEGYGKVDHFLMACFSYAATSRDGKPDGSLYFGGMEYGFDRQTKRLSICKGGKPEILVQDRHLFYFLWEDFGGTATYLEIVKPRSITWNDLDEAEQIVREQCPLAGYSRIDRCMVLPLLQGGTDRLFTGTTQVLTQNGPKERVDIFELGHPQRKIMIGLPQPMANLDPAQYPRCFRVENGEANLAYAINQSGLISAVIGTVSREDVFSTPGNPLFIMKKNCGLADESQEVGTDEKSSLELPLGSKCIGVADLKAGYLAAMKAEEVELLKSQLDQLKKD